MGGYHVANKAETPASYTLTCNSKGQWSPHLASKMKKMKCVATTCGSPTSIKFGSYAANGNTFNSEVTYQCATGYQMMGKFSRASCQANGQWTPEPLCTKIKVCSHLACNYQKHSKHGRISIAVTHKQAEKNGGQHRCSIVGGACMCLCWQGATQIEQQM